MISLKNLLIQNIHLKMTDRDIANKIWMIMKGISLPANYTDKDITEIIYKYWHRAIERERCLKQ
jgi:hypothetical protein